MVDEGIELRRLRLLQLLLPVLCSQLENMYSEFITVVPLSAGLPCELLYANINVLSVVSFHWGLFLLTQVVVAFSMVLV